MSLFLRFKPSLPYRLVIVVCLGMFVPVPCHGASLLRAGGLVSYPVPVIGENLLKNTGFKEVDLKTGNPDGWNLSNAFSVIHSSGKRKRASLMMKDAPAFPYAESIMQKVFLRKGSYRFGGRVKTYLADPESKGVRFTISGIGSTQVVGGTADWQVLETQKVFVPKDGIYVFKVESYAEPAGLAWFENLFIYRETLPLEVFLKYPNYRGMLFDDQSPTVQLTGAVDLGTDSRKADYHVGISVIDERNNNVVFSKILSAEASFDLKIDGSGFESEKSYLIRARLHKGVQNEVVYEYPSYRIVKLPATVRKEMTVSFDEHNRFLVRGKPTFWLGVYDSGMGYPATEKQWEQTLSENRRLFDLPINLYLNYWYGQASLPAMQTMMNVLQDKGIYYLQTGNAFNSTYEPNSFAIDKDNGYLETISRHPGLAGFYTVDEAVSSLAPTMFGQYNRLKSVKPDGMTFAALLHPNSLYYWRDTVDVLSMDPYPLAGAEPKNGYNLALVADWTRATKEAVMDSRPFMTVLQYFKFTSKGRWPNRNELRNMSYMAIAEGANGIMYWSLGAGALAYVCPGWCEEKIGYFEALKSVLLELKGIEPVLTSLDRPELLSENSNPTDIKTRVKHVDNKGYLIAYNYSNSPRSVTFTWAGQLKTIQVYNEGRAIAASGAKFVDSFEPFQAHVYEIALQ